MKNIKHYVLASGLAALLLGGAPLVFAQDKADASDGFNLGFHLGQIFHSDNSKGEDTEKEKQDTNGKHDNEKEANRIAGTVTAKSGTTLTITASDGTVYTVDAANASVKGGTLGNVAVGDSVVVSGTVNGSTVVAMSIVDKTSLRTTKGNTFPRAAAAGTVTSVNGSVFTINPFGPKATTTVTTNGSTIFKVNGSATTSSAVTVGSRVVVVGTTTATSSTGDSITASIVRIITEGLGRLGHFLGFR